MKEHNLMSQLTASSETAWVHRTLSAINRLLAILGYKTETDREKALTRFIAWLTFVEAYVGSQDSEVRATWTEAALRALGNVNRLTTTSAAEEAAREADGLIAQQLRRFPPREPTKAESDEYGPDLESTPAGQAALAIQDAWRERDEALAKLAERDADLLKYAAEIDGLRKQLTQRDEVIDGIVADVLGNVSNSREADIRRADDALSDAKGLLAKILGVETSHPLRDLAQGVAEMVAGHTRAAETLAEREASKLRADLQNTLRELATVREERDAATKAAQNAQRREDAARSLLEQKDSSQKSWHQAREAAWQQCTGAESPELARDALSTIRAELDDCRSTKEMYRKKLSETLIPQPKPDRVEKGQRWAWVETVDSAGAPDQGNAMLSASRATSKTQLLNSNSWIFLGYSS